MVSSFSNGFFALCLALLLLPAIAAIDHTNASHPDSSSPAHSDDFSTVGASMHLISAVFVPVIDFDADHCHTRIDIALRTVLQAACSAHGSGTSPVSGCSALDAFTFTLVNMVLSIVPAASHNSTGHEQQRFTFGDQHAVHASISGSMRLNDMGSAHHVRVWALRNSHSHSLQWCGNAAVRVVVSAELHSADAEGVHHSVQSLQTSGSVVVHVPYKVCVDLGEQQCYDKGVDAGCFWCQRARRCVHSSKGNDDAAAQCRALPAPSAPPQLDQYSSMQCTAGLQMWPLVAPLSNRNRICMLRSVCIADGQLTLFTPPPPAGTVADAQSSLSDARGIVHYDGWSSLKGFPQDVQFLNGDSSGFVPQARQAAALIPVAANLQLLCAHSLTHAQVVHSSIPSDFVAADDADVHMLQRHSGECCFHSVALELLPLLDRTSILSLTPPPPPIVFRPQQFRPHFHRRLCQRLLCHAAVRSRHLPQPHRACATLHMLRQHAAPLHKGLLQVCAIACPCPNSVFV